MNNFKNSFSGLSGSWKMVIILTVLFFMLLAFGRIVYGPITFGFDENTSIVGEDTAIKALKAKNEKMLDDIITKHQKIEEEMVKKESKTAKVVGDSKYFKEAKKYITPGLWVSDSVWIISNIPLTLFVGQTINFVEHRELNIPSAKLNMLKAMTLGKKAVYYTSIAAKK